MKKRHILWAVLSLASVQYATAQQKKLQVNIDYIEKYSDIAIEKMKEHGIPASITLAQGILESGAGKSELAQKSNNHFGIKCHNDWTGDRVYHDDDKKNECFRKYAKPELSYEDHSQFLKKPRYASLFELDVTDYKGWAKGLKACGYATAPDYATRLIELIETYELYNIDKGVKKDENNFIPTDNEVIARHDELRPSARKSDMGYITPYNMHKVFKSGKRKFVIAQKNDTYEAIARELDLRNWQIRKYNKLKTKGTRPEVGEKVYVSR